MSLRRYARNSGRGPRGVSAARCIGRYIVGGKQLWRVPVEAPVGQALPRGCHVPRVSEPDAPV